MKMVKQTPYKDQLDIPSKIYEVYIQRARVHRLLLVKEKGSTLPLISFEIITPDLRDLKTLIRAGATGPVGPVLGAPIF